MNKSLPALFAALVTTILTGSAILLIGGNAFFNSNGVSISKTRPTAAEQSTLAEQSAQIQDLQNQIAEYQAREAQYQTQLNEAANRLNSSNAQIQEYQQVLFTLQNLGIITIDNGRVFINR
ncbi:MAG TPA: hypothetical protein PLE14_06210 [Anaerolineales bacterium]|nr:hypothetical protein [Anaerolineales bacterium]